MSTFLELCKDVTRESGIIAGDLPLSVEGQNGQLRKIVRWTAQAWTDIQNSRNAWRWMRREWSSSIIINQSRYTARSLSIDDFSRWITLDEALTIYNDDVGVADEGALALIPWTRYRLAYGRGEQRSDRPVEYSISPLDELAFGPVPDASYTVRGEYYKRAQTLTANADVPEMPEQFHQLIVWKAMITLAQHEEAPFALPSAQKNHNEQLADLQRDQLPARTIASQPLA